MDSYGLLTKQNYYNVCKAHFSNCEIFLEGDTKKKITVKQEKNLQNKEKQALPREVCNMSWYLYILNWVSFKPVRCFYLFNLGTYNLIRSSGFLQLPHQSTLSKYKDLLRLAQVLILIELKGL